MKRIPILLGLLFITITTHRVASFFSGDVMAWIMALALTGGVYISAYFAKLKTTQRAAISLLIFFALTDIAFNTTEVLKWSVSTGRWDFLLEFSPEYRFYVYRIADPIYGMFPTIAAALLAWLARSAEKLGNNRKSTGKVPETSIAMPEMMAELPKWMPKIPATKEEFRQLYQEGVIQLPEKITSSELAEYLPVGERSVRNWLKYARNGHGEL